MFTIWFGKDNRKKTNMPSLFDSQAPSNYEVLNFHTPALQHSKIHLSWDEDEPQRVKALKRKFNEDQVCAHDLMILGQYLKITSQRFL